MFQSSNLLDWILAGMPFDSYGILNISSTTGYWGRFAPISGANYNTVIYFTMAILVLLVYLLNQLFSFADRRIAG